MLTEYSFDLEGMVEAKKRLTGVSQRILDAFRPDPAGSTLHLAGGACGLCAKCGKETGEPCRHPDRALASVESYGVDVYNTARNAGLKLPIKYPIRIQKKAIIKLLIYFIHLFLLSMHPVSTFSML